MQTRLVDTFPVEKEKYHLNVILSDRTIELVDGSDRLGFEVGAMISYPEVRVLDKTLVKGGTLDAGGFGVTGEVIYDGEQKAFFLGEPEVEELNVSKFPDKYQMT